eukprot:666567-Amphidinium_carterae.1
MSPFLLSDTIGQLEGITSLVMEGWDHTQVARSVSYLEPAAAALKQFRVGSMLILAADRALQDKCHMALSLSLIALFEIPKTYQNPK